MIGIDSGIYRGFLDEEVRKTYFPHAGLVTAGWVHPQGSARDQGDGTCHVSGRWQFGSGIDHADVIMAGVLFKTSDEDPGTWRIAVLDKDQVTIEDTWNTWVCKDPAASTTTRRTLSCPSNGPSRYSNPISPDRCTSPTTVSSVKWPASHLVPRSEPSRQQ